MYNCYTNYLNYNRLDLQHKNEPRLAFGSLRPPHFHCSIYFCWLAVAWRFAGSSAAAGTSRICSAPSLCNSRWFYWTSEAWLGWVWRTGDTCSGSSSRKRRSMSCTWFVCGKRCRSCRWSCSGRCLVWMRTVCSRLRSVGLSRALERLVSSFWAICVVCLRLCWPAIRLNWQTCRLVSLPNLKIHL